MVRRAASALVVLLFASGCLDAYGEFEHFDSDAQYRNVGVFEGRYMIGGAGSLPLVQGLLRPPQNPDLILLESARPAYGALAPLGAVAAMGNLGQGPEDESRVDIVMAIWHPDGHAGPRPVIVDAGPYYEVNGQVISNATQSTPFLLQNMLPRGYTVVQLAVRGTGTAGGCMDLFGPDETADLDQALTWIGEQEWSNGNIGMIGVSYDGSTPWSAAGTGNPYLKTIVPISGLPDIYDLMLRNGSAETRAAVMHGTDVYWGYGFSQNFPQAPGAWSAVSANQPWPVPPSGHGQATQRAEYQDRQNLLCPEAYEGQLAGAAAAREGSRLDEATEYWTERDHRERVLANYKGSVFLIHGLQDWNVDPHSAVPFNLRLREAGIEVKEWYGQWGHTTPDSTCDAGTPAWVVLPCRLDYGEVLARWFDKHLVGNDTVDTGPQVQVQDNIGIWRNVDSFPPHDVAWTDLALGVDGTLGPGAQQGDVVLPAANGVNDIRAVRLTTEPLPDGLHLSGLPQIKLPFSVQGQGGHVAAWLFDVAPDGNVRSPAAAQVPVAPGSTTMKWTPVGLPVVGHGQMNLRFYAGGEERQTLTPDERYVAQMELEPLDVHIPPGHRLMLWLFQYQYPDHQRSGTPSDVTLHFDGEARLRLPTVAIEPRDTFPVPGVVFPNSTYIRPMYVDEPFIPEVVMHTGPRGTAAPADGGRPFQGTVDAASTTQSVGSWLGTQAVDTRSEARGPHGAEALSRAGSQGVACTRCP